MLIDDFLVAPAAVLTLEGGGGRPLAFINLDIWPEDLAIGSLPAFPLIGLGDPAHPTAASLDAIVEAPISAAMLIRQVMAAPRAAAIAVQLLRSIKDLPLQPALTLESLTYGLLQGSAEHAGWLASRTETRPSQAGGVVVERHDADLHVTIDRPWARNAIDTAVRDLLFDAFTVAALDPDVRSIRLRSIGPIFSAGGDLEEFGTTRDPATAHLIRSRRMPTQVLAPRALILDVHVQGGCVGAGLEIAAFAGRLTASSHAWFQLPELAMGLIPGAGGCVSVPRRIGRQRAALMILSGRRISAPTALRWGLIDAIEDLPARDEGRPDQEGG